MAEETNNTPVTNIERNGVTLPIVRTEIKRGKNKGTAYYAPQTSDLNTILAWLGEDQLRKLVVPKLLQIAQGWTEESTDEVTNEFNVEAYSQFAQSFSARGESKADLERQVQELVLELGEMDIDDESAENTAAIKCIMKQIKSLNMDIASKKRERKTKEELAAEAAKVNGQVPSAV